LEDEVNFRKKAEEQLQETRAFLDLVVENLPAMLFVKDPEHLKFVLLNRAGEQLLGFDRKELIGKSDYDLFPMVEAEFSASRDKAVIESGQLQITPEETVTTRHNGTRLLRTLKMPVPDEQGRPKFLLGLSEDITDRKRLENAERVATGTLSAVIDASPIAIVCVASDRTVLVWSRAAEEMFGYTKEEVIGRPYMLVPSEGQDEFDRLFERALAGETLRGIHVQRRRKDGSLMDISFDGAAMHDASGVRGVAYALTDITKRKFEEMQLRHAQKMEAIGNLTGGMAHDFNNLLSVVIGNLDLLRERPGLDLESDELAREAVEAALRGADLTQRLLAFARRQPLRPKRLDLNHMIEGLSKLLKRTLGEDIKLVLDLKSDIWPVVVDPAQLESSLLNLANNARDAMPDGGTLMFATGNRMLDEDYTALYPGMTAGAYAMIEISDTGSGIAPDILNRVFDPFFTTKGEGKGTGLGLSMVFGFIKQSGGHINVYSEPNVGTTFRLFLPHADGAADIPDAPSTVAAAQGGTETVLAVEDNPSLRRVVARQLKELGYRYLEAEDGPSALKILEQEKVDLLFTDVVMPGGMSGYDLIRTTRARWPDVKALLTSGFPDAKVNSGSTPQSDVRLLGKPYRKQDLARAVRELLDA
jgi:PAS domain S-box-containing protein